MTKTRPTLSACVGTTTRFEKFYHSINHNKTKDTPVDSVKRETKVYKESELPSLEEFFQESESESAEPNIPPMGWAEFSILGLKEGPGMRNNWNWIIKSIQFSDTGTYARLNGPDSKTVKWPFSDAR